MISKNPPVTSLRAIDRSIAQDEELAAELARHAAFDPDRRTVDARTFVTGRPSDDDETQSVFDKVYDRYVEKQIESIRQKRIRLYKRELSKGTAAADIYRKLQDFNADLPERYRHATGLIHN